MKKSLMLVITILISWTAFSQKGMDSTPNTKCFTIPVVKQIAKDLLKGDSAIAQLKLTQQQLDSTEKKVSIKDSIISSYRQKESNFNTIIGYEQNKYNTLEAYNKKIELNLKTEKVKSKFKSYLSGGLFAIIIGALIILK